MIELKSIPENSKEDEKIKSKEKRIQVSLMK